MDIKAIFAENVKKIRLEKQLSQEELAFKSGLHRTYISDIERRKRSISLDNIQRIAKALDVDFHELVMSKGEKGEQE
jgi:transcriptional regulator with XRE-family HTH domain